MSKRLSSAHKRLGPVHRERGFAPIPDYQIVRIGTGAKIVAGEQQMALTAASLKDVSERIKSDKTAVTVAIQGLSRAQTGKIMREMSIGTDKNVTLVRSQILENQTRYNLLVTPKVELACGVSGVGKSVKAGLPTKEWTRRR